MDGCDNETGALEKGGGITQKTLLGVRIDRPRCSHAAMLPIGANWLGPASHRAPDGTGAGAGAEPRMFQGFGRRDALQGVNGQQPRQERSRAAGHYRATQ